MIIRVYVSMFPKNTIKTRVYTPHYIIVYDCGGDELWCRVMRAADENMVVGFQVAKSTLSIWRLRC
jgi:hypothetical protein